MDENVGIVEFKMVEEATKAHLDMDDIQLVE